MRGFGQWRRETAGRMLNWLAEVDHEHLHTGPLTVDGDPVRHPPDQAFTRAAHAELAEPEAE